MDGGASDPGASRIDTRRHAIDTSEIGTFEFDLSRKTAAFSPRTQAIFAAGAPDYVMPRTTEELFRCVHRDDVASVRSAARLHAEGVPFEAEFRLQHGAGRFTWVHSRAYRLVLVDGSAHVWGFISDVSARKRWEQRERALLAALSPQERTTEVLGMLAGGVAHNFNNLLTPILGHAQHLLRTTPCPGSARASLEEIVSSVLRANDVINRLLMLAIRTSAHQVPLQLAELAREALERVRPSLPETARVKLELDESCSEVLGSREELLQAIGNLCLNATEVLRVSGSRLRVFVGMCDVDAEFASSHSMAQGAAVKLVVEDNGRGMSMEVLDRAFDPFFTTKPVGQGLGLGLPMVVAIAKRHGGAVRLDSRPGLGTRCELYVPALTARRRVVVPALIGEVVSAGDG
jgi:signal transduction histidine kinase